MYADDLLLISVSIIDLQSMLNICCHFGNELGIKFNCAKPKCISFGSNKCDTRYSMNVNSALIHWVNKIKYLGIIVSSGKSFNTDLSDTRRQFYVSVNSIISKSKYTSDIVNL